jgi:hypothetical protein
MSARRQPSKAQAAVSAALYSLKEDAAFAFNESLAGSLDHLHNVGRAWANVQVAVAALDQEKSS